MNTLKIAAILGALATPAFANRLVDLGDGEYTLTVYEGNAITCIEDRHYPGGWADVADALDMLQATPPQYGTHPELGMTETVGFVDTVSDDGHYNYGLLIAHTGEGMVCIVGMIVYNGDPL